jgi:hypothetical protein
MFTLILILLAVILLPIAIGAAVRLLPFVLFVLAAVWLFHQF